MQIKIFRLIGVSGKGYDPRFYFEEKGLIRLKVKTEEGERVRGVLSPFVEGLRAIERVIL
ncbi:hypothetical protein [Helicobacter sp. 12S02634-8]|uniref:hypothetical protein n=1 Tax=Helicobacter sp. 12S02634-8 TaxID=1476199 RepID=UPI00117A25C6|nr:hypothetical protein [Helicobacter sp. 12S02634-8]